MSTLNGAGADRLAGADGFREWFWDWSFVLPFVWVMFSASRGFGILETRSALEAVETDALHGSPEGFVYLVLMVTGLLLLIRNRFDWKAFWADNTILVSIYLLILVSTLWSDVPVLTVKRFIKTFGVLVMVLLFLQDAGERKVISFLFIFVGIYLLCSLVYIIILPSLGTFVNYYGEKELIGLSYTKNSLAQIPLIGCLVYGYKIFFVSREKKISFIFLCLCFLFIIVADSITCFFLGVLSFLGFLMYRSVRKASAEYRLMVLFLGIIFMSLLALFWMYHEGDHAVSKMLAGFNRDISLTGRVDLWQDVLAIANENWMFGRGYGAFWFEGMDNNLWDIYIWHPNQAHLGFLDIYVQLGVVGLGLSLVWIGSVVGKLIRTSAFESFEAFRLLFVVVLLLHNITESSLLRLNHINWFLFLLLALASFKKDSLCSIEENNYVNNKL